MNAGEKAMEGMCRHYGDEDGDEDALLDQCKSSALNVNRDREARKRTLRELDNEIAVVRTLLVIYVITFP